MAAVRREPRHLVIAWAEIGGEVPPAERETTPPPAPTKPAPIPTQPAPTPEKASTPTPAPGPETSTINNNINNIMRQCVSRPHFLP